MSNDKEPRYRITILVQKLASPELATRHRPHAEPMDSDISLKTTVISNIVVTGTNFEELKAKAQKHIDLVSDGGI